jgi:hypothetical protein
MRIKINEAQIRKIVSEALEGILSTNLEGVMENAYERKVGYVKALADGVKSAKELLPALVGDIRKELGNVGITAIPVAYKFEYDEFFIKYKYTKKAEEDLFTLLDSTITGFFKSSYFKEKYGKIARSIDVQGLGDNTFDISVWLWRASSPSVNS